MNHIKYLKNIGLGNDERLRGGRNEIAAHTVGDPRRIDELTVRIHRGGMDGDDVADAGDDWKVVEKCTRRCWCMGVLKWLRGTGVSL